MKLDIKQIIKGLFNKIGYSVIRTSVLTAPQKQKPITRGDFFNLYFSKIPKDFFFVQIGAHDGIHGDPIHDYIVKYALSGVVVEPQKDVFERLRKTYENLPIVCVNAAIGTEKLTFYTVKREARNEENFNKMTRIASFNKDVIRASLKSKIPRGANVDNYIVATPVTTMTFERLVNDCSISRIDLLQLDCEGYDYEILKTVDFNRFSPSLINYESMHFPDRTRKDCENLLTAKGYNLFRYGGDTCAYKIL